MSARCHDKAGCIDRPVSGFTLIELLVVMAVTLLLVAVLTPTVIMVKRITRETICRMHVRRLCTAFQGYATDHNQDVVSCMEWVGIPQANPHATYQAWPYMDSHDVVRKAKLWPYVENETVYSCPTFSTLLNGDVKALLKFSYVMNGNMNHMWRNQDPAYHDQGYYKYVYRKLVHIRKPEAIYLFGEEMPWATPGHTCAGLNDGVLLSQWYPGRDGLGYFHGDGTIDLGYSTVAFVDGHTETAHIWETGTFSLDPFDQ